MNTTKKLDVQKTGEGPRQSHIFVDQKEEKELIARVMKLMELNNFGGLAFAYYKRLYKYSEPATVFTRKEEVFEEGEEATSLYLILDGEFKIQKEILYQIDEELQEVRPLNVDLGNLKKQTVAVIPIRGEIIAHQCFSSESWRLVRFLGRKIYSFAGKESILQLVYPRLQKF